MRDKSSATVPSSIIIQPRVLFSAIKNCAISVVICSFNCLFFGIIARTLPNLDAPLMADQDKEFEKFKCEDKSFRSCMLWFLNMYGRPCYRPTKRIKKSGSALAAIGFVKWLKITVYGHFGIMAETAVDLYFTYVKKKSSTWIISEGHYDNLNVTTCHEIYSFEKIKGPCPLSVSKMRLFRVRKMWL